MLKRKKINNNKHLLYVVSALLIFIGINVIGYKYYCNHQNEEKESRKIENFIEKEQVEVIEESKITDKISNLDIVDENYIAILEIPIINLRKGLVNPNSEMNDINYNIEILEDSDMPDVNSGNFILAAHSGNSIISYFKDLDKLKNNDLAYVYYAGKEYMYQVVNKYEIKKTGYAKIERDKNKNTLTLISCKHGTNYQIIVIFELIGAGKIW